MDMIYNYIQSSNRQNLNIAIMGDFQQSLGKNLVEQGHSVDILSASEETQNKQCFDQNSINNGVIADVLILSTELFFIEQLNNLLLLLNQTKNNSILFVCETSLSLPFEQQTKLKNKQTPMVLKHFLLLLHRLGFISCLPQGLLAMAASGSPSIAFMFQRNYLPAWQIQSGAISLTVFKQLFFNCFAGEITAQDWQWKYGNHNGKSIVAYRDGELIAYYGGITRDISYFGENHQALQICDVMVEKQYQGILSKKGIFHQLASTFLENHIGYYAGHLLGFGFPTHRAMKLAKTIKVYDKVDSLVEIHWQAHDTTPQWFTRIKIIKNPTRNIIHQINQLWQKMKRDHEKSIIGVRDWDYLEYRFVNCPAKQYQLFMIQGRFTAELKGVFVLRYIDEKKLWMLIDLVGVKENFTLIIHQALRVVKKLGGEKMIFWITQSHYKHLPESWIDKKELNIEIPCNTWTAGPAIEQITNKWWLTAGDADFM